MEPMDPADLRISDADREKVADLLRQAAGDGRIDLDELDERLEKAYAARTYRDLVPITLDLPGHAARPAVPDVRRSASPATRRTPPGVPATHGVSFSMMSETKRSGTWDIGEQHTAVAVMGSTVIDLRQARFPAGEVVITATAVMGSIEVVVDEHTAVRVTGVGIMGTFSEGRASVEADLGDSSPVVRINGVALMGSVEVHRREAPDAVGGSKPKHLGH